jgi:hypothetical protein
MISTSKYLLLKRERKEGMIGQQIIYIFVKMNLIKFALGKRRKKIAMHDDPPLMHNKLIILILI